ncbi:MAG: hypothetical protein DMF58_17980 [Acidobacteria bacterium]|nr:MAG: hypothetical protein DMF58_17980 [Acidobacteriota bacterium]
MLLNADALPLLPQLQRAHVQFKNAETDDIRVAGRCRDGGAHDEEGAILSHHVDARAFGHPHLAQRKNRPIITSG